MKPNRLITLAVTAGIVAATVAATIALPVTAHGATSGVACTDSSTGHFFRVSHQSYDVG